MNLYPFILFLFFASGLHAQTVKYKFTLPKRESRKNDTVAFRPYTLMGTYKNGEISLSIEYEKDFPNAIDYTQINPKADALRQVSFQFEFFDSTAKKILDQTTRLKIELRDGHAIAPGTEIFRANYKIPEPFLVKFTWSFYDQPGLTNIQTANITTSSFEIYLHEHAKDYSSQKAPACSRWGSTWSLQ